MNFFVFLIHESTVIVKFDIYFLMNFIDMYLRFWISNHIDETNTRAINTMINAP